MAGPAYEPIDIPAWAWHRDETRGLLATRDVAGLFRFATRYGGASQTRIASACGLGQGRVNEIVNGRREVGQFAVLVRIADGLGMPDESRAEFGLAGRHPSREIVQVFPTQEDATAEIHRAARSASSIDTLAVRGLGLVGLNNSLLRSAISHQPQIALRVLLLNPESDAAAHRAAEINESAEQMAAGIRVAEASLRAMANSGANVELYFYASPAVWRIISIDGTLYVSSFNSAWEGHESSITKIAASPQGALYHGYARMLDQLFTSAERVV